MLYNLLHALVLNIVLEKLHLSDTLKVGPGSLQHLSVVSQDPCFDLRAVNLDLLIWFEPLTAAEVVFWVDLDVFDLASASLLLR